MKQYIVTPIGIRRALVMLAALSAFINPQARQEYRIAYPEAVTPQVSLSDRYCVVDTAGHYAGDFAAVRYRLEFADSSSISPSRILAEVYGPLGATGKTVRYSDDKKIAVSLPTGTPSVDSVSSGVFSFIERFFTSRHFKLLRQARGMNPDPMHRSKISNISGWINVANPEFFPATATVLTDKAFSVEGRQTAVGDSMNLGWLTKRRVVIADSALAPTDSVQIYIVTYTWIGKLFKRIRIVDLKDPDNNVLTALTPDDQTDIQYWLDQSSPTVTPAFAGRYVSIMSGLIDSYVVFPDEKPDQYNEAWYIDALIVNPAKLRSAGLPLKPQAAER